MINGAMEWPLSNARRFHPGACMVQDAHKPSLTCFLNIRQPRFGSNVRANDDFDGWRQPHFTIRSDRQLVVLCRDLPTTNLTGWRKRLTQNVSVAHPTGELLQ